MTNELKVIDSIEDIPESTHNEFEGGKEDE
jgi:hypothetical protein